eukprot:TRINITY_DN37400_c0_g1_i2.p1 TRINITY_DN37400_c0_g1~~TRINITY_DN37400_c0_g1_i2.p1  ORF type:complete len:102 (+),score=29.92 TRINITY_DN37400_c0_g1_i2:176-481(+)
MCIRDSSNVGLAAAIGFFVMTVNGIASIVGCALYCASQHPEEVHEGMVAVVQVPAIQAREGTLRPELASEAIASETTASSDAGHHDLDSNPVMDGLPSKLP